MLNRHRCAHSDLNTVMSWECVPDAVVELLVDKVAAADLPYLALAERRCHIASMSRLSAMRPLRLPPFSLDGPCIIGRHSSTDLDLYGCSIDAARMRVLASALAAGGLPSVTELFLLWNPLGDAGMSYLASALGVGALTQCSLLSLAGSQITDEGMKTLASALANGALKHCTALSLACNQISDEGLKEFASAIAGGASAPCRVIELYGNPASQEAKRSVQRALKDRWLDGNFLANNLTDAQELDCSDLGWCDDEMTKLAFALTHCQSIGALASISYINLEDSKATESGKQRMRGVAEACGFHVDV